MDLFAASGVELPRAGAGPRRPAAPRTLRLPLFAYKVVEAARVRLAFAPSEEQTRIARDYARKARAGFGRAKETAVRSTFIHDILIGLLGYRPLDPEQPYTLAEERQVARGAVDVALGRFDETASLNEILAPFELKGPTTHDLDAPMPGRGRSPVQQAWDYAADIKGARWVLISNCLEIRLYGFGRGRESYEVFDLAKLDDPEEHARLYLLLAADRALAGALDELLRETDSAYRDITDELYKQYSALRDRLIDFLVNSDDGPRVTALDAIEPAQKILDRILFIAFAQRTDLLPHWLLERASKANNEFLPQPLWSNFATLFRAVDKGDKRLDVWPYNGGLFAEDPVVDRIVLPDALAGDVAGLGQWDFKSEVPVTLLGHIFEQSVTDIERLKARAQGQPDPAVAKRKREGVVYTPDMVTRFLIEKTIGVTLSEAFEALRARHGFGETASREAQIAFWREYLATLRGLSVVDPACGSGAFLVAAYDALYFEYARATKALAALDAPVDFDVADEILAKNLYGVDLNPESVEITRLSLWLKTARREHRLASLEATIRVGDSLIEDAAYTLRPFDWRAAFPEVFARGGFDIVVGNPPYVRMEFIKAKKPYLAEHYAVASDRADLYAYFYDRGLSLLRDGGRLGFISSSTFFRTGSGEPLRRRLIEGGRVETIVDFGDAQIFGGVTTYPAILSMCKGAPAAGEIDYLVIEGEPPADLGRAFQETARRMPRARLTAQSWRVEDDALARLRDKIRGGRKTLGEIYGAPLYGIKTGLNEAFVIDTPTRDRLIARDPKSADLLKPFLRGENVKRWRVEPEGLWLINTPKGKVDIDAYPAVRDWLLPFKPQLEKRATKQEWFELQQAQLAYQPKLDAPKLVWAHFQAAPSFCIEASGAWLNNKCFFVPTADFALVALLNSRLLWSELLAAARIKRGGYIEAEAQYVEQLPIPDISPAARARLAALAQTCTDAAHVRHDIQSAVRRRLLDLAPPDRLPKLTGRLHDWHDLDFAALRAEIKRAFRADIPVKERGEWETYLNENAARVKTLTAEIAGAEVEIDALVYQLFGLTADEISLLESSLHGQ
jgi:hypothetical protein